MHVMNVQHSRNIQLNSTKNLSFEINFDIQVCFALPPSLFGWLCESYCSNEIAIGQEVNWFATMQTELRIRRERHLANAQSAASSMFNDSLHELWAPARRHLGPAG